jgi:hypothetical protein
LFPKDTGFTSRLAFGETLLHSQLYSLAGRFFKPAFDAFDQHAVVLQKIVGAFNVRDVGKQITDVLTGIPPLSRRAHGASHAQKGEGHASEAIIVLRERQPV